MPQIEVSYIESLTHQTSPERNLYLSILNTYIEDIDSFFLFVKNCKKKNKLFDAKSIAKIKRNNYSIENLTLVINLINTSYKNNPGLKPGCLHCELICDLAGIDYFSFRNRAYKYIQKRADENNYDVEDLLINFYDYRDYFKGKK